MKKIVILVLWSFGAFSALPPFFQSTSELNRIINDERVYEKLGSGQLIEEVRRTDSGWIILTQSYSLKIDVVNIPSKLVGAHEFELVVNDPKERN